MDVTVEEVNVTHSGIDALLETNKVEASIQDNTALDIVVTKKDFVITGDNIYIPVSYEEAPQWLIDFINGQIGATYNQNLNSLEQATLSLNTLIAELEVAKDTYTQSIISEGTIDTKINTAVTTLNSTLSAEDATLAQLIATKVTGDEAEVISANVLSASVASGSINSLVGQLNTAIANGDTANANSISVLNAQIDDETTGLQANASYLNNVAAFVGVDAAGVSTNTNLSAYLIDGEGNIGGAESKVTNGIYTDASGSLQSMFEYHSLLHKNGIYYNAGFGLNVTNVGGDGSKLNPFDSEFLINAEKFKFTNNAYSGTAAPFTIDATGAQPNITFNGKVTFGSGQTGTIDEAVASIVETVSVGDWNTLANKDAFAQELGYDNYAALQAAATAGQTLINGGYINTGLISANAITADKINTNGLVADAIEATTILGNDIVGANIAGANITGAVIKASYLDLDGELEVLTNYHITVADYNANPSLYPDAVYISGSNEYRLPSLSSVSEVTANVNTMSAGGVVYGKIRSYNTANAGHNVKAVKIRPTFASVAHQIYSVSGVGIPGPIGPSTYYYADFSYRLGTVELVRVRISATFGAIGPVVSITTPYGTGVTHQYDGSNAATLNATNIPILGSITVTCNITYPWNTNWAFLVSCGGGLTELPFDWANPNDKINIYMNQSSIGSTLKLTPSIIINNMI